MSADPEGPVISTATPLSESPDDAMDSLEASLGQYLNRAPQLLPFEISLASCFSRQATFALGTERGQGPETHSSTLNMSLRTALREGKHTQRSRESSMAWSRNHSLIECRQFLGDTQKASHLRPLKHRFVVLIQSPTGHFKEKKALDLQPFLANSRINHWQILSPVPQPCMSIVLVVLCWRQESGSWPGGPQSP
jgi:hypothetical protein